MRLRVSRWVGMAAVGVGLSASAATPGLPFTEDFADTNLKDSAMTTANWSVEEQKLIHAFHASRRQSTHRNWTGSSITADAQSTCAVALGDVDGDGDLDLVAGNYNNQVNRLYLNNGTADPFNGVTGSDITSDAHKTYAVAMGDLDGDGDLDLVAGNDGQVNRLYLNNGTADPFAGVTGMSITDDTQGTVSVALGDVNGDGHLDVVVGNCGGQVNRVYLNNGTADPFAGVTGLDITADAHNTYAVALGDLDGDGDLDLVAGNSGQANRLYLNNGTADPFAGVAGSDITADAHGTLAVALGDVNGDGHLDLVAGNDSGANRLYLNNGTADPFNGVIGSDITGDGHITYAVALGDVDGDGRLDVVAGNYNQVNRLYLNNGTAAPFAGVTGSDITGDADNTVSLALGDVDGDGRLDVVAGNFFNEVNRLYLNNGVSDPFNGATAASITADTYGTFSIAVGDVNRDGHLDLVTGNYGERNRLYLNNGTTDPFNGVSGSDISTDTHNTRSVALGDVDGDGDLDLVVANWGQPNRLYLNNGTADPFNGVTGSDITADIHDTASVALGDVNGDGHLDLVAGNSLQAHRLYLNNGTTDPFNGVSGSDIAANTLWTRSVALGDVDRDGHLDLVAGNADGVNRLYLGDGTGVFAAGTDITADAHVTWSVALGDVNGDGNLDVVAGNNGEVNRLYLGNGNGTFAAGTDIAADPDDTRAVALGDVDNDGDLDLVAVNFSQVSRLYLNNGTAAPFDGVSGSRITADAQNTTAVVLDDMNGDGNPDVVAGNYNQVSRLYLNNGRVRRVAYGFLSGDITADTDDTFAVALGDMNGDGYRDLVAGNYGQANRLYLNNGTADPFNGVTGTDIGDDAANTHSVALGDVNEDGRLDVVAGNDLAVCRLYTNNGTATPFAGVVGLDIGNGVHNNYSVALGDMNGDGHLDLVVGDDQTRHLYLGNGNGTFAAVVDIGADSITAYSVALGDVNGDGHLDVVSGTESATNRLYLNNGTANPFNGVTGSDIGTEVRDTYAAALGDVNGDGHLDVVAGNAGQPNRLYLNNGTADPFNGVTGTDIAADSGYTYSVALGDMNGDGRLDVVAANYLEPNRLYLNNGTADPFNGVTGMCITVEPRSTASVALGDVDRDGHLDVAAGNEDLMGTQVNRLYLFSRPFDFNRNLGGSLQVNDPGTLVTITNVTLTVATPPNTDLAFYLSNNGGTNWVQAYTGRPAAFTAVGNDLRWKAVLKTLSSVHSVQLSEVKLQAGSPPSAADMLVLGTNGQAVASGEAADGQKGTDVGAIPWGDSLTRTLAVTNPGSAVLHISAVTTSGAGTAAFALTGVPATLSPGGVSSFSVTFQPAAAGIYTCSVSLVNDSTTTPYVVNLAGTAVRQAQTLVFPAIGDQAVTSVVPLAATASSGLPVSFAVVSGPGAISYSATLTFSATGTVAVVASQDGDASWEPAPSVTNLVTVQGVQPPGPQAGTFAVSVTPAHGTWTVDPPGGYDGQRGGTGAYAFTNAPAGVYVVTFGDLAGFQTPSSQTGALAAGGTVHFHGAYKGNAPGDFGTTGTTTLALYDPNAGRWYAITTLGRVTLFDEAWGGPGLEPVAGDYDGDGQADLAVYDQANGLWYIRRLDGTLLAWALPWGGPGLEALLGDYTGDGAYDLGLYDYSHGLWYIRTLSGEVAAWALPWGGLNFLGVAGDYDGDARWDLAVYDMGAGAWYIRTLAGGTLAWALPWGGPGLLPVLGDFDGDGLYDLAIYAEDGAWYIRTLAGDTLAWNLAFGGPGYYPVPGDYDGDGRWDLAVYGQATGVWYIRSLTQGVLLWDYPWGGGALRPVLW